MANVKNLTPKILKWEGGFVNDPADAGGATNKGVTLTTWKSCGYDKDGDGDIDLKDLKLITDRDVEDRVLKPHYWDRWRADEIKNQSIANILVDWVYMSGKWGITIPQQLLNVTADGIVGKKTLTALNSANQEDFFKLIWWARYNFFHKIAKTRPANKKFLNGWINRLNDYRFEK